MPGAPPADGPGALAAPGELAARQGYPSRMELTQDDLHALEVFYTSLLVLSSLVIGWFSVYVVYKLFTGQR